MTAKEDRVIARQYERRKVEKKRSWLKTILDLQNKDPRTRFEVGYQNPKTPMGHNGEEIFIHPLNHFY